jgi:hypothetical protein
MAAALSGMLDRVEDELFTLAEKAPDRDAQNLYLDARTQARANREAMEGAFRQHFIECFNSKVLGEAPHVTRGGELELVDEAALEQRLAMNEMSRELGSACESELFALGQRMGFLLERPDLEEDANPVSPATICAALKDACDQIQSDYKVRMALLRQLARQTEGELQRVYHDLNTLLVERRILPEVRASARRSPSAVPKRAKARPAGAGPAAAPVSSPRCRSCWDRWPPARPGLRRARPRAGLRGRAHAAASRGARDGRAGQRAAADQVRAARDAAHGPGRQHHRPGGDAVRLRVRRRFDPVRGEGAAGRLQIPVLKVALLDRSFFSSPAHPARGSSTCSPRPRSAATAARTPPAARSPSSTTWSRTVLEEFDTDLELFEKQVARVNAFIVQQGRAEAEVVERSRVHRGARARRDRPHRRRRGGRAPPAGSRLGAAAGTRHAAGAVGPRARRGHLAEGEGSPAWQSLLHAMDDLLWSVEPKSTPDERKRLVVMLPGMLRRLHEGFARAALPDAERDQFLGALVDCHAHAVKSGMRGLGAIPTPEPVAAPRRPASSARSCRRRASWSRRCACAPRATASCATCSRAPASGATCSAAPGPSSRARAPRRCARGSPG